MLKVNLLELFSFSLAIFLCPSLILFDAMLLLVGFFFCQSGVINGDCIIDRVLYDKYVYRCLEANEVDCSYRNGKFYREVGVPIVISKNNVISENGEILENSIILENHVTSKNGTIFKRHFEKFSYC